MDKFDEFNSRLTKLEQNGIPGVRDFFATSALSMLSNDHWDQISPQYVARRAYMIADAMLEERKKYEAKGN